MVKLLEKSVASNGIIRSSEDNMSSCELPKMKDTTKKSSKVAVQTCNCRSKLVLNDFSKDAVFKCYSLMKSYLTGEDVEDKDAFCKMSDEVNKYRICIPPELFDKISNFIDNELSPIVYAPYETFSDCYLDDIGEFDENDCFHIYEGEEIRFACGFFDTIFNIEKSLDELAMREFYPLLVA